MLFAPDPKGFIIKNTTRQKINKTTMKVNNIDTEKVKHIISQTKIDNTSLDDKILKLTAIKAEILIHLTSKGYKFQHHAK